MAIEGLASPRLSIMSGRPSKVLLCSDAAQILLLANSKHIGLHAYPK